MRSWPWLCEPCLERHTEGEACPQRACPIPQLRGHVAAPDPGLALCTGPDCPSAGRPVFVVGACLPPGAMTRIRGPAPRPASKWEIPLALVAMIFYGFTLWKLIGLLRAP